VLHEEPHGFGAGRKRLEPVRLTELREVLPAAAVDPGGVLFGVFRPLPGGLNEVVKVRTGGHAAAVFGWGKRRLLVGVRIEHVQNISCEKACCRN
jgi:hypothetical protein